MIENYNILSCSNKPFKKIIKDCHVSVFILILQYSFCTLLWSMIWTSGISNYRTNLMILQVLLNTVNKLRIDIFVWAVKPLLSIYFRFCFVVAIIYSVKGLRIFILREVIVWIIFCRNHISYQNLVIKNVKLILFMNLLHI